MSTTENNPATSTPVSTYLKRLRVGLPICALVVVGVGLYFRNRTMERADSVHDRADFAAMVAAKNAGLEAWPVTWSALWPFPGESISDFNERKEPLLDWARRAEQKYMALLQEKPPESQQEFKAWLAKSELIMRERNLQYEERSRLRSEADTIFRSAIWWAAGIGSLWGAIMLPLAYRVLLRPALVSAVRAGSATTKVIRDESAKIAADASSSRKEKDV